MFLSLRSSTKIERPPMPCSGLQTIRAVLAQKGLHFRHVASNQRRRAALGEPCGVDLLIHVPQPLRAVDDESALLARRARGCRWSRCIRCRTAGPCASRCSRVRPDARSVGFAEREPVVRVGAHRERPCTSERHTVTEQQIVHARGRRARSRAPEPRAASRAWSPFAYLMASMGSITTPRRKCSFICTSPRSRSRPDYARPARICPQHAQTARSSAPTVKKRDVRA